MLRGCTHAGPFPHSCGRGATSPTPPTTTPTAAATAAAPASTGSLPHGGYNCLLQLLPFAGPVQRGGAQQLRQFCRKLVHGELQHCEARDLAGSNEELRLRVQRNVQPAVRGSVDVVFLVAKPGKARLLELLHHPVLGIPQQVKEKVERCKCPQWGSSVCVFCVLCFLRL